ncbi:MAG: hypothetical protein ACYCXY_08400 [Acidimicrobiales bacterium]
MTASRRVSPAAGIFLGGPASSSPAPARLPTVQHELLTLVRPGHDVPSAAVRELYQEYVAAGCPRCIYDGDCGSGNADLDRSGALAVLASLKAG